MVTSLAARGRGLTGILAPPPPPQIIFLFFNSVTLINIEKINIKPPPKKICGLYKQLILWGRGQATQASNVQILRKSVTSVNYGSPFLPLNKKLIAFFYLTIMTFFSHNCVIQTRNSDLFSI